MRRIAVQNLRHMRTILDPVRTLSRPPGIFPRPLARDDAADGVFSRDFDSQRPGARIAVGLAGVP
jgi:hypothetical protein